MICPWKYYQAYLLTIALPFIYSYPSGDIYKRGFLSSGYPIRQRRELWKSQPVLTFNQFGNFKTFSFSTPAPVTLEDLKNMSKNTGFSSSVSQSDAQHINSKDPGLSLAQALAIGIDIKGPLGEVGSSFKGSQNTGKGATSAAGALTGGLNNKTGQANALTAAQADIVVDGDSEGSAKVNNNARVSMSGNAAGNAAAQGSVNTKKPDGIIATTPVPPLPPLKAAGSQALAQNIAILEMPKKTATNLILTTASSTTKKTTPTTTTTTSTPTTTTITSTTTSTTSTTEETTPSTTTELTTDSTASVEVGEAVEDTTLAPTVEEPVEIGGESEEENDDRPRGHGRHRPMRPPPRRPMQNDFRNQQFAPQYNPFGPRRDRFAPAPPNRRPTNYMYFGGPG